MIGLIDHIAEVDQAAFRLINGMWTTPLLDRAMIALSYIGDLGAVWITLLGAMAVFGKKAGRRIALAGLAALAIGFASSEIIKEVTLRPRPFVTLPDVRLLVARPGSFAFPSGHATSALAAASGAVLAAKRLLGRVSAWDRERLGGGPSFVPLVASTREGGNGQEDAQGDQGSRIRFLRGKRT